jgi:hypothetical protein
MKGTLSNLSKKQLDFIFDEFKIDKDFLESMSEDELNNLYDDVCDIEVDETLKADDSELSERGKTAVEIVTIMGEAIAKQYEDAEIVEEDEE